MQPEEVSMSAMFIVGAIAITAGALMYRGANRFQKQFIVGIDPMDICWPESIMMAATGAVKLAGIGIVGIGGVTMLF